jgi:importin subunit beta-1
MADTLLGILEKTTDARECMAAQKQLEQAAQANLPNFLVELSRVLANPKNNEIARYQAALQIKNHLTSNHVNVKIQYQHRWLQIDNNIRLEIKKNSFNALGSESRRPSSIPQVIAAIGSAELPNGQWPELVAALVQNVNAGSGQFERTKEASLEAIGYICCDVKPELLAAQSNVILNAICAGLLESEPSAHVRLAAITAMLNSLEFTKENFDRENERNHIMQVICQNTLKNDRNGYSDVSIRTRALECLVKIVGLYYQYMPAYMTDIFQLTIKSMEDDEQICLQVM